MESIFVRYRNLLVLLALLVAQILGLAMQVRRTRTAPARTRPRRRKKCQSAEALGQLAW